MTGIGKQKGVTPNILAIMGVAWTSLVMNMLLAALKLVAGILGKSSALISDSIHSATDVFSTIIVMIGVKMGSKEPDLKHQYGHERLECVTALILVATLSGTGIGIGYNGIHKIITGNQQQLATPTMLALVVSITVILIKEVLYLYTKHAARTWGSETLMADAWHHQSDALASFGGFAGIVGVMIGFPLMDCVASIFISLFIFKAAADIFRDAVAKMVDEACDSATVDYIRDIALSQEGVIAIDDIKTRLFGNKKYVDIEISADGSKTLLEVHEIAHRVHDDIERQIEGVKHCMVHVNPFGDNR